MIKKIAFSIISASFSFSALAASYPTGPVKAIVPFPPGGTTDVVARLVSEKITPIFGSPLIVENHSGASGTIGSKLAADAKPDGYTVIFANNQTHATNASLFSNLSYDIENDFVPIAMLTRTKHVLIVPENSKINNVDDLVKMGQERNLNYASSSMGSSSHLVSEFMGQKLDLKLRNIPYRGASPAVLDTMAGHVDFMTASYGSAMGGLKAGSLKPLIVSGEERDSLMPDVPTFKELGLDELSVDSWIAVYAPVNTPEDVIQKWSESLSEIMKDQAVIDMLNNAGFEVWFKDYKEMSSFHGKEIKRWEDLVNKVGVKLD